MNFVVLLYLVAAMISFAMASYLLAGKLYQERVLFAVMLFCLGAWLFSFGLAYLSPRQDAALLMNIGTSFSTAIVALWVLAGQSLTGLKNRHLWILGVFVAELFMTIYHPAWSVAGNAIIYNYDRILPILAGNMFLFLYGIFTFAHTMRKLRFEMLKNQMKLLLAGLATTLLIFVASEALYSETLKVSAEAAYPFAPIGYLAGALVTAAAFFYRRNRN